MPISRLMLLRLRIRRVVELLRTRGGLVWRLLGGRDDALNAAVRQKNVLAKWLDA
jgi:hypothetical protein